eukprot:3870493-Pyramimonas_sp.AAC.1
MCFGRVHDIEGAAGRMIRGVDVPGMAFWRDSGSPRCNSQVHRWRWNTENNALACFRVSKRLSSTEAGPFADLNCCGGL